MKKRKKFSISQTVIYLVLSLWALTTIYPILLIIQNSFKAKDKILENSFSLPIGELFTTANYRTAFDRLNIFSAYRNSMIISCTVAAAVILLAGLAAFALVRFSFKGRELLQSLVVAGMMFPVFSTIIPVFTMLNSWHLVNTDNLLKSLMAVALPQIAGNLSFATVAIFSFLWSYNDLFTQMFLLRLPEQRAITRLLNELTAMEGTNYGLMAAAVALVVIPVIIVYCILQKYIIKGMTAGAIKG